MLKKKKVICLFRRAVLGTKYAHLESKNSIISLNLCWFLYPFIPSGWLSRDLAILCLVEIRIKSTSAGKQFKSLM